MSEHNPFAPQDSNSAEGSSNVFLDLNKPDDLTGVPNLPSQEQAAAASAGFNPVTGKPASKVNTQVLLAAVVFAVGVGAIYGMRSIGMKAGIKENAVAVDYTPETTTPDFIKRFDTVMTGLDESSVAVVLESTETLPERPFTMATAAPANTNTPQTNPMDNAARLAAQRAAEERLRIEAIESNANLLELQSVLGGSRPVARISGQPVREGMKVNDQFTVKTISGQSVILECEGLVFRLTLSEPTERLQ